MKQPDEKLFKALSKEVYLRVNEFTVKGLTTTAWACATVNLFDEKLFRVLARRAERKADDPTPPPEGRGIRLHAL